MMAYGTKKQPLYFSVDKDSGKFIKKDGETISEFDYVSGEIGSLTERKSTLKDGTIVHKLCIELLDGDEVLDVSFGWTTSSARTLVNSLLSIDPPLFDGVLNLSSWKKKDAKYINLSVMYNGARLEWKYRPEEIPGIERVELKNSKTGNITYSDDTSARDEFWEARYREIIGLVSRKKSSPRPVLTAPFDVETGEVNEPLGDDDIPF